MNSKPSDLVSLADVGLGVSQVLPVLVALALNSKKRSIIVDQPELHLHPRAQRELARIIVEAVTAKKCQVLIETHSDFFLSELLVLVAQQALPHADFTLHWFKRNQRTGAAEISTQVPDKFGRFDLWPVDFTDVSVDTQLDFLRAQPLEAAP